MDVYNVNWYYQFESPSGVVNVIVKTEPAAILPEVGSIQGFIDEHRYIVHCVEYDIDFNLYAVHCVPEKQ